MPETGDGLGRAYRDLPREEPPAHLDAAILAASRRAVASAPEAVPRRGFAARWGAPISVAAVLVLGIAISLRMQLEQPGIETSLPERAREAPVPKAKVVEPPAQVEPPTIQAQPQPVPKPAAPPPPARQAPPPRAAAPAFVPTPVPAPAAAAPAAIAPQGMTESKQEMPAERMRAPAAPAAATPELRAAPMSPSTMMKRSAASDAAGAGASANAREAAVASPEIELERIARLRAEGRDEEADRALEEFRKRHPDYRIAEPMLERVRRK
jgi:hypothetical protein